MYYVHHNGMFAFGSEIKALVGKHGIPFDPDEEAIYRYLVGNQLPSPQKGQTFFKGIHSLPPGHWLLLRQDGTLTIQRYWSLDLKRSVDQSQPTVETVHKFRELFTDSVRLRLRSDVPIGTCLSGGVDSSSIVSVVNQLMAKDGLTLEQLGQHQKTFSAVYETAEPYNERPYIDKVLQHTGAEGYFTYPTLERLLTDVERLVWHQDEPFLSTSIYAQWCVMSKVRERGVTVLLDGQGADETMAGYRPYVHFISDLIRNLQFGLAFSETRKIQNFSNFSSASLLAHSLVQQLPAPILQSLRHQRSFLHTDFSALNPNFVEGQNRATPEAWRDGSEQSSLSSHLRYSVEESSLPHLLRYEDRNSMAYSIEARVPFLDYRLVEFVFHEASSFLIRHGWTKWILRQAMTDIVPDEIIWRKDKVGFETPEAEWIRTWLRQGMGLFGEDALSGDYLNLHEVQSQMKQCASTGEYPRSLWKWINLELWFRVWQAA